MYTTTLRKPLWLGLTLALTACGGTPDVPPPAPEPVPVVEVEPEPQPFENEVISVPVSPVQTVPSSW
ncbi:hypothetical protein [Oceanisphaera arctica]|uniref:Uncharacterized protein n=1 Tax=Oceanisphaera arctica TaxID=641510 RepID=A0A2P5TIS4_9GAMM|nr:hypothetical protein [Oceanisphaera arctica]PPL14733.1 hypothetical protein UN63_14955 [Oceanisphaera arctica]GHA13768.1 hypothetical protein GCM10007082_13280 [Oceanisphaera arctica]